MKGVRTVALGAAAGIAAALFSALSPAVGQEPGSALKGHDIDAPVDVAADRIEVQDRADRAIISGNVVVRQGNLQLDAVRVTITYSSAGNANQIQRIDASGGVFLRSPRETARGQYAIYDTDRRLITLLGGVTLTRGESHVSGGRLVIDLESGRAVMDGGGPATDSPPGTTAAPAGRVTGTFTVPRRGEGNRQ